MNYYDLLQWPGMVTSVVAAWLVAGQSKRRRQHGFWWFLASNILWIVWGWHTGAWALIVLQVALFTLNIRGLRKNEPGRRENDRVTPGGRSHAGSASGRADAA